jgi:hypothetical protein
LRVEQAIDDWCKHDKAEGSAVAKDAAVFRRKRSCDPDTTRLTGVGSFDRFRSGMFRNRAQPEPGESEISDRERSQDCKRLRDIGSRYSPRGFIEQNLNIPAQR